MKRKITQNYLLVTFFIEQLAKRWLSATAWLLYSQNPVVFCLNSLYWNCVEARIWPYSANKSSKFDAAVVSFDDRHTQIKALFEILKRGGGLKASASHATRQAAPFRHLLAFDTAVATFNQQVCGCH